jgi:hypothetical protein
MNSSIKTAQLSNLLTTFFGGSPLPRGPLDWVTELLNPESLAKNALFLTALAQNWAYRYDPAAFYHVEEVDKSRGYEAIDPNTGAILMDPMTGKLMEKDDKPYVFQHSQGHLEKLDYKKLQNDLNAIPTGPHGVTPQHQFSELKPVGDMPLFVKKNINISENSPEYKAMFDKLYPGVTRPAPTASSNKFVRVAQTTPQATSQATNDNQKAQEIKKLIPKWNIKALVDELDQIAQTGQSQGYSNDQITLQIQSRLKKYQESIKPLNEYLIKNGYGQKTS